MTTITVTQEDIDNGDISTSRCAVALAMRRAYPNKKIFVCYRYLMVGEQHRELPPGVKLFMKKHDAKKANLLEFGFVEPFTFNLDIPQ